MTALAYDDQTWTDYQRPGPHPELRETLILRYSQLVRYVASRMAATLPTSVDHGDLASYGLFGLIDAIDKFEPERGVRFETYAITRIRGAILDELRAMDWAPRSVRARYRWVVRTSEALEQEHHRSATYEEIAHELGWSVTEVRAVMADGQGGAVLSIDEAVVNTEDGHSNYREKEDLGVEDPVLTYEVEATRVQLAAGIAALPERERILMALYFREHLTLAEIGKVLGVGESRVCQIYTSAALLLREHLARHH